MMGIKVPIINLHMSVMIISSKEQAYWLKKIDETDQSFKSTFLRPICEGKKIDIRLETTWTGCELENSDDTEVCGFEFTASCDNVRKEDSAQFYESAIEDAVTKYLAYYTECGFPFLKDEFIFVKNVSPTVKTVGQA